jgi:hypothetical protein
MMRSIGVLQVTSTSSSGPSVRTVYVGMGGTGKSLYERTTTETASTETTVEHVHFIYAGDAHSGNAFALRVLTAAGSSAPTVSTKYNHFDHLGSVTATSNETGQVVDAAWGSPANAGVMGYDPWGARRNPEGEAADSASFALPVGHRGFTGHGS